MKELIRLILDTLLGVTKSKNKVALNEYSDDKPLGHISKKFESGRSGPGTIGNNKGDPGGKSYGCHQLASRTGTLQAYLKVSKFKAAFSGINIASKEFDKKWKEIARKHKKAFELDQLEFIKRTHFDPIRRYADLFNIPYTRAINEALFSISVQHGGARKIIRRANILPNDTEHSIIIKLYDTRTAYVKGLGINRAIEASVLRRYRSEVKMVLDLI